MCNKSTGHCPKGCATNFFGDLCIDSRYFSGNYMLSMSATLSALPAVLLLQIILHLEILKIFSFHLTCFAQLVLEARIMWRENSVCLNNELSCHGSIISFFRLSDDPLKRDTICI